jgi:hypothetical protein
VSTSVTLPISPHAKNVAPTSCMEQKEQHHHLNGHGAIVAGHQFSGLVQPRNKQEENATSFDAPESRLNMSKVVDERPSTGRDDDNENHLTWRTASPSDDLYVRILRSIYFPFLIRFNKAVLLSWLVLVIIGLKFGLQFLSSTSSDVAIPDSTPSKAANDIFVSRYPNVST